MPDMEKLRENLEKRGFAAVYFPTAREAADYLDGKLDGRTIAFGGSMTVREMGLYERLAAHNQTFWHWDPERPAPLADGMGTEVYITSVNGAAETGELVNIDGTGNRVASTCFGHQELYLILGVNKVAPDYEGALWRARNIAAPKNAQRLGRKTPCAVKGDRCYDCQSPERICRALTVLWEKPSSFARAEVVLVGEPLGY
ncbi:MAG TPA: lactate utilization protein [Candidatus Galloscillospira excrementavium]|nr:lactate utilization protein [Candidatus Galloscillospira excrementavium]